MSAIVACALLAGGNFCSSHFSCTRSSDSQLLALASVPAGGCVRIYERTEKSVDCPVAWCGVTC